MLNSAPSEKGSMYIRQLVDHMETLYVVESCVLLLIQILILIFFAIHYLVSALMRILSILILLAFQESICMDWKTISKAQLRIISV